MDVRSVLNGIPAEDDLLGDPRVCVAVLDGPVDLSHPCFAGADLTRLDTLVQDDAGQGLMSLHGSHVTSLLFGQPGTPVTGMVPRCRGLLLPIFRDTAEGRVPQLDLARAIEQAVEHGAHVINISGGQRSADGQSEGMLERALRLCDDRGVLVVSAVGNDGCDCLQVPAAFPSVLAVGASGTDGEPLETNNWGAVYRSNGVTAPGQDIEGAAPGGGVRALTGSSFATPAVTGTAAVLLGAQLRQGHRPDPKAAGQAILSTAQAPACVPEDAPHCRRRLVGRLDAPRAYDLITGAGAPSAAPGNGSRADVARPHEPAPAARPEHEDQGEDDVREGAHAMETNQPNPVSPQDSTLAGRNAAPAANTPPGFAAGGETAPPAVVPACGCGCGGAGAGAGPGAGGEAPGRRPAAVAPTGTNGDWGGDTPTGTVPVPEREAAGGVPEPSGAGVAAACAPAPSGAPAPGTVLAPGTTPPPLVYAIGRINFDFGTEARRDSFRQLMGFVTLPEPDSEGRPVYREANPYDPKQMRAYLSTNPWASDKLIWTLEVDRTPIYALEAETPFGMDWGGPIEPPEGARSDSLTDTYYPPVSRVYKLFRDAIWGQVGEEPLKGPDEPTGPGSAQQFGGMVPEPAKHYISRVSVPGVLTGETVRLFSGQRVPKLRVDARGVYLWNETELVNAVIEALKKHAQQHPETLLPEAEVKMTIRAFLDKVYYQFRNLGQTSADRALNYAGTNAYNFGQEIAKGLLSSTYVPSAPDAKKHLYTLDTITVRKSAFERMGSDCQDVIVSFIDPENDRRARVSYLFPVDVNEPVPITLGPVHRFLGDF
ncbi:S8 family serine peptidase [Streptomyces sp. PBH53]|uniref:cyanobactin maturation protease PatG family protein n=1 Tax=Streptomyces sp. PBH53 TaxID=1577075 RepID=UPI000B1EA860|nr:S8 family serine peptidase [Streptomyces sp. PBH53]